VGKGRELGRECGCSLRRKSVRCMGVAAWRELRREMRRDEGVSLGGVKVKGMTYGRRSV
jgi:hypothetical protein